MNGCQLGSLTYDYAVFLKNGNPCADTLFCKLSWLLDADCTIGRYIPVGTNIAYQGHQACGLSNTSVLLDPNDPFVSIQIAVLELDGNDINDATSWDTLLETLDHILELIYNVSGVSWHYTQITPFQFLFCSDYTQNAEHLVIQLNYIFESPIGGLNMDITLSGGIAPDTPVYQTADMNCITATKYDNIIQARKQIVSGVKCCDIPKPKEEECVSSNGDANIELRQSGDFELRELGN